jgi:hypothetical protein
LSERLPLQLSIAILHPRLPETLVQNSVAQVETEVIVPAAAGIHMYELQRINVAHKRNDRIELQKLMKNGVQPPPPRPARILAGFGRSIILRGRGKVYNDIRAAEKPL